VFELGWIRPGFGARYAKFCAERPPVFCRASYISSGINEMQIMLGLEHGRYVELGSQESGSYCTKTRASVGLTNTSHPCFNSSTANLS
jgi:hypothetical protein